MIGTIIGDIVGSTREFANTFDYNFELFPPGSSYTDDTICTIAIADAILKGKPYRDSLLYWCRRYPHPKGAYGGSFGAWIRSKNPLPYDSFGNGAAMRISPVAWAFSGKDLKENVDAATGCSHNHPEGIKGAYVLCLAFQKLIDGAPVTSLEGLRNIYYPESSYPVPAPGVWNETCQGCVPLALHLAAGSTSFEDAIRRAVSYGGDSDTLAAIVGSMAEAAWGIPPAIRNLALTFLPQKMQRVAEWFEYEFGY